MDDGWKYNGGVEVVKRAQQNLVIAPAPKLDSTQFVLGSSSEKEAATGEDVASMSSSTPLSSLLQDQAATSKATHSGEGGSSPVRDISRSQVSLGGFLVICLRYAKISIWKLVLASGSYSTGCYLYYAKYTGLFLTDCGGSRSFQLLVCRSQTSSMSCVSGDVVHQSPGTFACSFYYSTVLWFLLHTDLMHVWVSKSPSPWKLTSCRKKLSYWVDACL